MMKKLLVFILALAVLGCEKKTEKTEEPAKPAAPEAKIEKIGKALAGAEEVAVLDLLKNPDAYDGKTIRVSGKVHDFCHHRRAWFGVSSADGQYMVRVFTAPRFQAPADCVGKHAVAEGKVELITLKPEDAKHYAESHKFLSEKELEAGKPIKRPLIRAFGAELK